MSPLRRATAGLPWGLKLLVVDRPNDDVEHAIRRLCDVSLGLVIEARYQHESQSRDSRQEFLDF